MLRLVKDNIDKLRLAKLSYLKFFQLFHYDVPQPAQLSALRDWLRCDIGKLRLTKLSYLKFSQLVHYDDLQPAPLPEAYLRPTLVTIT